MAKKALLVGINYPGKAVELRGCVNDVRRMERCLIDRYGFSKKDINVLIDTDPSGTQPTGKNIREALIKLIDDGQHGDYLVFHYSGHGTRIPSKNGIVGDATGFDECITPCDMNLIMDHEFRYMVAEVKEGCRLTVISDSCHSGGLIEEVEEQIGESVNLPKKPKPGFVSFLVNILTTLLATCGMSNSHRAHGGDRECSRREIGVEDGEAIDIKTRYLSVESYISLLEEQTGQRGIKHGKIRQTLVKIFGEDSSHNVILSKSMEKNSHRGSLGEMIGEHAVNTSGSPSKVPKNGILLSGCQTDQRSEDVYVTRTGKAHGAFSDAIQTILSKTRKNKKITNKEMVLKAREILKRNGFSQRPGLYCHDRYINDSFIC